jgi:hypothetical protein
MKFKVNEQMNLMHFAESIDHIVSMLPDSLYEIAGYADIQSAVALACENIDSGLLAIHRDLSIQSQSEGTGFPRSRE